MRIYSVYFYTYLMDDSIKRTNRLIVFTIAYNLAEGFFAIFFGIEENSTTLLSFGLDSFIEIFASSVALLGLSKLEIFSEERAEKLIAYSFLILHQKQSLLLMDT